MTDTLSSSVAVAQSQVAGDLFTTCVDCQTVISTISWTTLHSDEEDNGGLSILPCSNDSHLFTTWCNVCCNKYLIYSVIGCIKWWISRCSTSSSIDLESSLYIQELSNSLYKLILAYLIFSS